MCTDILAQECQVPSVVQTLLRSCKMMQAQNNSMHLDLNITAHAVVHAVFMIWRMLIVRLSSAAEREKNDAIMQ